MLFCYITLSNHKLIVMTDGILKSGITAVLTFVRVGVNIIDNIYKPYCLVNNLSTFL